MVDAVDAGALVTGFATRESGMDAVGARSTRSLEVGTGVGSVRVAFAVLADLECFEAVAFCAVVGVRLAGVLSTGGRLGSSCGEVGVAATGDSSGASGTSDSSGCLGSVASDPASVVDGLLSVSGAGSGLLSGAALSATEVVFSAGGSGAIGGVGVGSEAAGAIEAVDASACTGEVAGVTGLGAVRVLTISGVRTSCG